MRRRAGPPSEDLLLLCSARGLGATLGLLSGSITVPTLFLYSVSGPDPSSSSLLLAPPRYFATHSQRDRSDLPITQRGTGLFRTRSLGKLASVTYLLVL